MWTNEGLKRVIARKDVPFAGVNDNLQKLKFQVHK